MTGPWLIRGTSHFPHQRGMVMGIVNVTPDSFSDGGRFRDAGRAVEHALRLISEGAEILDIGGESTRPGAEPVDVAEELRRVLPVIRGVRSQTQVLISIDTMKAAVARAALDAGADILNDVSGLRGDAAMQRLMAESDAGIVVMHMLGEPRTMQKDPHYDDVVAEVRTWFAQRLAILQEVGIAPERVLLDPGFGFGKTLDHNLALLRALPELTVGDRPLMVGVSRKSMIAHLLGSPAMEDRFWPTVALTAHVRDRGVGIVRVHDVKGNVEALRMMEAILGAD
ncbi:MAG: dihydropteroate synthase [Verrucomicrobiales bacterium]|nr:dihydropteroate synthase [Verrucomicrobiales bacterium]